MYPVLGREVIESQQNITIFRQALNSFGLAAAKVVPEPDKPAFTIDDFISRKITNVNKLATGLGVKKDMTINEAIEKLS